MALVAAVALTLVSPGIMKAIIPADSLRSWDRRQYVAHLAALVMIWWTMMFVPLVVSGSRLRRALRTYGCAAILAASTTILFLVARQAFVVVLLILGVGRSPMGLFKPRLFDILEHAPVASAASVIATWAILAATGAGGRSSNGIERLGSLVGWTWIALGILGSLVWHVPIPWLTRSGITW